MPDFEDQLADCIGTFYEAATGARAWQDAGERLCSLFEAPSMALNGGGDGGAPLVLMLEDEARAVYAAYYHRLNPYAARARADYAADRAFHVASARLGEALVADEAFTRSEYYHDFARPYGHRYMIGGMLGIREATPLALFRPHDHRPFSLHDVRLLNRLLPHLQRALELREKLELDRRSSVAGLAALDALPAAVALVDGELRVQHLNAAARLLVDKDGAPLTTVRSGPQTTAGTYLAARSRPEAAELARLVASAAGSGSGGSMRLAGEKGSYALLVSPMPGGLVAESEEPGLRRGAALVLCRPLRRPTPPPSAMLSGVFGLSTVEAEVAATLFGGRSAEQVARQRGVSLLTIRNQIRSVIAKAEAENLRDLERLIAELTSIMPARA